MGLAVVAALLVAGCGSHTTSASATIDDEQLIRAALIQEGAATTAWDFETVAALTCREHREYARTQWDRLVPPMSTYADIEPALLGADKVSAILHDKIPGSTVETTGAVAQALVSGDESAYTEAMKTLIRQTSTRKLVSIDNVHVTGDTATAEATITSTLAGDQPQTDTRTIQLAREDGQWKDCTPPSSNR